MYDHFSELSPVADRRYEELDRVASLAEDLAELDAHCPTRARPLPLTTQGPWRSAMVSRIVRFTGPGKLRAITSVDQPRQSRIQFSTDEELVTVDWEPFFPSRPALITTTSAMSARETLRLPQHDRGRTQASVSRAIGALLRNDWQSYALHDGESEALHATPATGVSIDQHDFETFTENMKRVFRSQSSEVTTAAEGYCTGPDNELWNYSFTTTRLPFAERYPVLDSITLTCDQSAERLALCDDDRYRQPESYIEETARHIAAILAPSHRKLSLEAIRQSQAFHHQEPF